ncbi:MAG: flagellar hook-associated protein FlgK [Lachnospiraceae bacterium]|jgi:flagellar hook-associated protein 1 FlgK|nr:flagellar hook-associated protein FlgK [Lachnospiraceae bacterium]
MPSQFFGLYISGSGLRTSNAALNTTANNIANTQTVGYSRQQVVQEAADPLRTFTTYGCAGAGVDVIAIERVRDHFYDVKYWNNQGRLGNYEVQSYYMKTLEEYFIDDEKSGFSTLFNRMSNALQSLTTNASGTPEKATFIASMRALTDYFNNMYGNLQEMQSDLNMEIKQTVDEINAIAEKVAVLNKQINTIEMAGGLANELRDQRENLVDQLSLLVDTKVDETPVYDMNDPTRKTGASNYMVTINGGQVLINGNDHNFLVCKARLTHEKVNQTDVDGLFDVKWQNGNDFGLQSAAMGGRLRGLVEMRDGNNGFYFNGTLRYVNHNVPYNYNGADIFTSAITVSVADVNLMDMKLCSLTDSGGRVTIGGQVYYFYDWVYEGGDQYTFYMDNDRSDQIISADKLGREVRVGSSIDFMGIPYYMTQMNAWIRGFAEKVNSLLHGDYVDNGAGYDFTANGYDINGDPGALFFTGSIKTGGQYSAEDLLAAYGNGLYELTAGNIAIFDELARNADRLGSKSEATVGVEQFVQITKMIELLNSKKEFSYRNGTAKDFLQMLLGDIALNASNSDTFYRTYQALSNSIDNQRSSISGVDEDEEAVNMVKYQYAYNLSSRMIQTLSQIYDRLILQTGV